LNKAEKLLVLFKDQNLSLSLAESSTGGLISKTITQISGCSKSFLGSVVSYSNASKQNLLLVAPKSIINFGAVSHEVALEMAIGAKKVFESDISLSITGIAGPEGGSQEKPVGTVFIAMDNGFCKQFIFKGSRAEIRQKSCIKAIELLISRLENSK